MHDQSGGQQRTGRACPKGRGSAHRPSSRFIVWALWLAALLPVSTATASPPVIERIEPTSGPPGSQVRLVGRRLASCLAELGAQPMTIDRALPSRLRLRVPESAVSGPVRLTCGAETVVGPEFRVTQPRPAPVITRVSPSKAGPGAVIQVLGKHFAARLTHNAVEIGGKSAVIRSATPAVLRVVVPEDAEGGVVRVRVAGTGEAHTDAFRVRQQLRVDGLSPARAGPGAELVLTGAGFSETLEHNKVTVGGRRVSVVAASADTLRVQLPSRPRSGAVVVTVPGVGRSRAPTAFTRQGTPRPQRLSPERVRPGGEFVITGSDLGADTALVQVTVAGRSAEVVSASPQRVVARLAPDAQSGPVAIVAHGVGPVEMETPIEVLSPLRISRFSPRAAPPGATLTISGTGFSARAVVTIAGQPASLVSTVPGQLRVRVPDGASGRIRVECAGARTETLEPFVVVRPPRITSVSPERVVIGDELTIRGAGFGDNPKVLDVTLGGQSAKVLSLTQDRLVVRVAAKTGSQPVKVTLPMHGSAEGPAPVKVLPPLRIRSVRPARPRPDSVLVIRGTGFVPDETAVDIAGKPLVVESIAPRRLTLRLPADAASGTLTVRLTDGRTVTAQVSIRPRP